jgi:hypothetical protein
VVTNQQQKIIAFVVFLCTFLVLWAIILLVLKYYYGYDVVGCAAGGNIVDVRTMKKQGLRKSQRKHRITRNWRIQIAFLLLNCCIPPVSFCLFHLGLRPLILSLQGIQEVNDLLDSKSYLGIQIITDLLRQHSNRKYLLKSNEVFRNFEKSFYCPTSEATLAPTNKRGFQNVTATSLFGPNMTKEELILQLYSIQDSVTEEIYALDGTVLGINNVSNNSDTTNDMEIHLAKILPFLHQLTIVSESIDRTIDTMYNHDWIIKLFITLMNICVTFFIVGVILTRNNIDWPAFQAMITYCMVPSFCLIIVAIVIITCFVVSAAMMNADFCTGGSDTYRTSVQLSPANTLLDMALTKGYASSSLLYQSLSYYGNVRIIKISSRIRLQPEDFSQSSQFFLIVYTDVSLFLFQCNLFNRI